MNEMMRNMLKLQTLEFADKPDKNAVTVIAELRGNIPPQFLVHYDRLRVRGKKGLAPVRNQVCSACHMRLTLGVIMTLKHDQDMQLCENCGRFLFLPDETETAPIAATLNVKSVKAGRKSTRAVAAP
jgi:predicted  nucleic acid-binding Zn-ribbon protein